MFSHPRASARPSTVFGAALSIVALAGAPALGADPPLRAADALFHEGKALMAQGSVREACTKFARSLALVRRGGTLLNLATCREQEGRHATALVLYQEALSVATADGRSDRVELARREIEIVRAKLSWLDLALGPAARTPGLLVTCDGAPLPRSRWDTVIPMDPGPHTFIASAAGHTRFEITITVGESGHKQRLQIPALEPLPRPHGAPPSPPGPGTSPWRKPVGFTAIAAGLSVMTVGGVFGVKAIANSKESQALCPSVRCSVEEGLTKNQDARTAARAANVMIPIGALAAGAGIVILLTMPKRSQAHRGSLLWLAPAGAGANLGGAW